MTGEWPNSVANNTETLRGTTTGTALHRHRHPPVAECTPVNGQRVPAGPLQFSGKTVSFVITNNGAGAVDNDGISLSWPAVDGKLQSIQAGGTTIYNTAVSGPSVNITSFAGSLAARTVGAGQSQTLTFTFANTVSTNPADYDFTIDCRQRHRRHHLTRAVAVVPQTGRVSETGSISSPAPRRGTPAWRCRRPRRRRPR